MHAFFRCLVAALCILSLTFGGSVSANDSFDFYRDVYDVLQRSCFECHGPDRQEAGLRLDTPAEMSTSAVIEIGDPDASELIRRVELPQNHDEVMPVIGQPLRKREVAGLRRWIAAGCPWPDDFTPPQHWAYVVPTASDIPTFAAEVTDQLVNSTADDELNRSWMRQPIDAFVLQKLLEKGLLPSPPAHKATLLRRVTLDLIGLPPTLEEVLAFENDPSEHAFERLVDDLLSRPQFGERWARPWLDLARYADSHGFQRDDFRDLWAYRDWVIQAINNDMPFDQFTIEQIAGDLLPDAKQSQRIATGFHRCAPTNVEAGSLPEETRVEQVIDRVNTTASVWLGSTLECAQCHDHKFDPFTTKEYYQMLAFFNSTLLDADLLNPKKVSSIAFQGASIPLADADRDAARRKLRRQRNSIAITITTRRNEIAGELADRIAETRDAIKNSPKSFRLNVARFESQGNTDSYQIREDGAVLLVGTDPPATDRYEVTAKLDASKGDDGRRVVAIRLDVLTDSSLPGTGPGRGDDKRNNFVLNEFTAAMLSDGESSSQPSPSVPLHFDRATADFSQANYDVGGAIDDAPKTGWAIAPQFSRPHHAVFRLSEPIDLTSDQRLRFILDQRFGGSRTIGCFQLSAITGDPDAPLVPANITAILDKPVDRFSDKQRKQLIDYLCLKDPASVRLRKRLDKLDEQIVDLAPDTTQVMVELDQPRPSYVFTRGDYRSIGEAVSPGTPQCLHPMEVELDAESRDHENAQSRPNRLTLARWLVSTDNPLVARVHVNRLWGELFGAGLVRTPEDFGIKGERPTHPELLDWLAVDFVRSGWSMKHVLRRIVLSSTYQQSSDLTPELLEIDDQNRLLARGPRVRMDAEMIRDNALAISDLISLKQCGPPVRPYQPRGLWVKVGGQNYPYEVSPVTDRYRRGVYVVLKRGAPYPSFVNFDANNRFSCTVERSRSNTPLQSLTLLNDPVYVEVAKAMAVRAVRKSRDRDLAGGLRDEFRRAVARAPSPTEFQTLLGLYQSQHQRAQRQQQEAKKLVQDVELPHDVSTADFAAWYAVATVLINLHETITKE